MERDALIDYCLAKPGAYLDYPFDDVIATVRLKTPTMQTGRIFAHVFVLHGRDTATFRCEPDLGLLWREQYPGVVVRGWHFPPAQHPYANTLPLDGQVPDDDILDMADEAYDAMVVRLPRYRRQELARLTTPDGRKIVRVVAACIVENGYVLATERAYGDDAGFDEAGWWEFPGGKIEPGEDPVAALHREIDEELGATIEINDMIAKVDYDYPAMHLTMACFRCCLMSDFRLGEHRSARWLRADDLDSVRWLPADLDVLPTLKAVLNTDQQTE